MYERVVLATDYRRERWKNGLGWTTEIIRVPEGDDWRWRLSLADSDRDAEFSKFLGVDRELVLLAGAGLRLRFHDGESCELRERYESKRFAGELSVWGEPIDGPTRQLNLMWRRDLVRADVALRRLSKPFSLVSVPVAEHVLYMAAGTALVRCEGRSLRLRPGDSALLNEGSGDDWWVEGEGEVLWITLRSRVEG